MSYYCPFVVMYYISKVTKKGHRPKVFFKAMRPPGNQAGALRQKAFLLYAVKMVLKMLQHALAELFAGVVFEEVYQVEVGYLGGGIYFFELYDVPEDGQQHVLKALHGLVARHFIDFAVEGYFVFDTGGLPAAGGAGGLQQGYLLELGNILCGLSFV